MFRCDADVVINNIFKAFDSEQTGKVVAQELLMCFSMSMKGTGECNMSQHIQKLCQKIPFSGRQVTLDLQTV